jgi:hypothetical protein
MSDIRHLRTGVTLTALTATMEILANANIGRSYQGLDTKKHDPTYKFKKKKKAKKTAKASRRKNRR